MAGQLLELVIAHEGDRYRAEVWVKPFTGWMVSATRWVSTRMWAIRDGRRYLKFNVFHVDAKLAGVDYGG